jgi:hypothetical protein
MVKCIILAATLIAAFVVLAATVSAPADAQSRQWQMHGGGYCPVGTCALGGGRRARNIANCSAAHCHH